MALAVASIVSAAIVLVSPFMGQLQSFLRRSLSTRAYVLLFGVALLSAISAVVVIAFFRIRERRAARFAVLLTAGLLGAGYMWLIATPYPEVNAVERVHFVEYGLIAFLFYRAALPPRSHGRQDADPSTFVLPLLAALVVGTFDEWLQWFIPVRVGEAHDVFLNLASITCGVLFGLALLPPESFSWRTSAGTRRRMGVVAAGALLVFAAFVSQVHLGYENQVPGIGRFRSHYSLERLIELQKDRRHRWNAEPPLVLRRLSREDQYLDEGLWHIRQRNRAEPAEAWHENLILERYFAPVLDIPTYAAPEPNRWSIEQRRNVEAIVGVASESFVSVAEPYPIVPWRRDLYWGVVAVVAIACVVIPTLFGRQRNVERRQ